MVAYCGAELGIAVVRVYRAHHALPVLHVAGLKTTNFPSKISSALHLLPRGLEVLTFRLNLKISIY